MDFVDCADLALLLSQHACLQLNHFLRLAGCRFRCTGTLRLQVDAWSKTPPHQSRTKGDQQQAAQDLQPQFRK